MVLKNLLLVKQLKIPYSFEFENKKKPNKPTNKQKTRREEHVIQAEYLFAEHLFVNRNSERHPNILATCYWFEAVWHE